MAPLDAGALGPDARRVLGELGFPVLTVRALTALSAGGISSAEIRIADREVDACSASLPVPSTALRVVSLAVGAGSDTDAGLSTQTPYPLTASSAFSPDGGANLFVALLQPDGGVNFISQSGSGSIEFTDLTEARVAGSFDATLDGKDATPSWQACWLTPRRGFSRCTGSSLWPRWPF